MPSCGPTMRQPGEPDEAQVTLPEHDETFAIHKAELSPHPLRSVIIGMLAYIGMPALVLAGLTVTASLQGRSRSRAVMPETPEAAPPDPAAVQECYRRLLTDIDPGILALRNSHPASRERYPIRQAITQDGQTECSATLAIEAKRVARAPHGR